MTQTVTGPTNLRTSDDARLNEKFNTLLREAAHSREERARLQSTEDAVAARQEAIDFLALARVRALRAGAR